ncbi:MAG: PqqD family protein [Candidatus Tectomicrobia bacterium]|nr:PqqD family protein [Candidatus Tectomicrobia bacterium]
MKQQQMQHPSRRQDLIVRPLDDEVIVLDPQAEMVHALNPTARAIWDLLDGRHGMAELVEAVCGRFDVRPEQAEKDIQALLELFRSRNLLDAPLP